MRLYKYSLLLSLCILLWTHLPAYSGKRAGCFLDLGVDPRAIALGEAFGARTDGATSFGYNPSGVSFLEGREAFAMYASLFGLSQSQGYYHVLAYGQSIGPGVALAVGWVRLGVDDIPEYPELEGRNAIDRQREALKGPIGHFSDREDAYYFSFAKNNRFRIDLGWQYFVVPIEIPIGISLKVIRYSLEDHSAQGLGIDCGAMLKLSANDLFDREGLGPIVLGLAFQDIANTDINWDTKHRDTIRYNVRSSVSYGQPFSSRQMHIVLSIQADTRDGSRKKVGLEWLWKESLAFRVGYNGRTSTGGLGLRLGPFRVDYALMLHELGGIHRVGAGVTF